jgi:actin-related protein 9
MISARELSADPGRQNVLKSLGMTMSSNTSPLILIPPPSPALPNSTQALYAQLAFERLNVPAFAILPPSLASIFALGQTTGLTIHLGYESTHISVITDSLVREECSSVAPVGRMHCGEHFVRLLLADAGLEKELRAASGKEGDWEAGEKERYVAEVAKFVWEECMDGDDIEVLGAQGAAVSLPGKEAEDDAAFDVAKKWVTRERERVLRGQGLWSDCSMVRRRLSTTLTSRRNRLRPSRPRPAPQLPRQRKLPTQPSLPM